MVSMATTPWVKSMTMESKLTQSANIRLLLGGQTGLGLN